jgi:hypothetical protein
VKAFVIGVGLCFAATIAFADEPHTFNSDGQASINCECVAVTNCTSQTTVENATDDQKQKWGYQFPVAKGMTLDLGQVCFRKADMAGVGVCCGSGSADYDKVKRLFKGTMNSEP